MTLVGFRAPQPSPSLSLTMNPQNKTKELYADLILDVMISDVLHKIARCQKMLVPLKEHYESAGAFALIQVNMANYVEDTEKVEMMNLFKPWVELSGIASTDDNHPTEPPIISRLKRAPDFGELIKMHLVVLEHTIGSYNRNISCLPSLDEMSNDWCRNAQSEKARGLERRNNNVMVVFQEYYEHTRNTRFVSGL
ncbi:hypothetical protein V8C43DRAFT_297515 [Trichoderma afarasin]